MEGVWLEKNQRDNLPRISVIDGEGLEYCR